MHSKNYPRDIRVASVLKTLVYSGLNREPLFPCFRRDFSKIKCFPPSHDNKHPFCLDGSLTDQLFFLLSLRYCVCTVLIYYELLALLNHSSGLQTLKAGWPFSPDLTPFRLASVTVRTKTASHDSYAQRRTCGVFHGLPNRSRASN